MYPCLMIRTAPARFIVGAVSHSPACLPLMTQTDTESESLLSQRTFGTLH